MVFIRNPLEDRLIEGDDLRFFDVSWIARRAGIGHSRISEEVNVFFKDTEVAELTRDTDVVGQLLNRIEAGLLVFFFCHVIDACNAHSAGDVAIPFACSRSIEFQDCREENGASDAVRNVIEGTQGMGHRMVDAEADVGKAHAGDVLAKGHFFPGLHVALDGFAEPFADDFNGFEVHHIRQFPGVFRDISFNSVDEGIHARSGAEFRRHRRDHIGVDDGDDGDVMGVTADEFTVFIRVRNDVVNRDFCGSPTRRRDGDDG